MVKSPTIKSSSTTLMDFPAAMKEIIAGKKIHKLEWKDRGYYGYRLKERLVIHKPDGKSDPWLISDGDMLGGDYITLD